MNFRLAKQVLSKWSLAVVLLPLLWSCTSKPLKQETLAQQKARLDSIVKQQQLQILQDAAELRRDRLAIEVKEKVDSILAIEKKKSDSIAAINVLEKQLDSTNPASQNVLNLDTLANQ